MVEQLQDEALLGESRRFREQPDRLKLASRKVAPQHVIEIAADGFHLIDEKLLLRFEVAELKREMRGGRDGAHGADRIALNGDFANKVGTYGLAVQAHFHSIPFHPVAPSSTVDTHCARGRDIPIEERGAQEVLGFRELQWAPEGTGVFNPSFDVTPVELVTSLVLDRGVISQAELKAGKLAQGV